MNLYLLKAKVIKTVIGISGKFESVEGKLVHAPDLISARNKFETSIRRNAKYMDCDAIRFEYIEIFDEIK